MAKYGQVILRLINLLKNSTSLFADETLNHERYLKSTLRITQCYILVLTVSKCEKGHPIEIHRRPT